MALQALRNRLGDATFFEVLGAWAQYNLHDNVSTPQLIRLVERQSGLDLTDFFASWLYTQNKPEVSEANGLRGVWEPIAPARAGASGTRWANGTARDANSAAAVIARADQLVRSLATQPK